MCAVSVRRVIDDPLTEAERLRASVLAHAAPVRAANVANAAILLIHVVQREPHRHSFARVEHEVVTVLMWRGRLANARRLVEVLHVLRHHRTIKQKLSEFSETAAGEQFVKPRIVVAHALNLLQRRWLVMVFVKDLLRRQPRNDDLDEAIDVRKQFGQLLSAYKLGNPYSKFGQLTYEMWRAVRLVIDTVMHALGWTRQEAIDFFKANTGKSEHDIVVEVDRYIVWPGQALAYKIGELKIKELKAMAKDELGEAFDIRAFHDQVLGNGALPLRVLETHIKEWLAEQKAAS